MLDLRRCHVLCAVADSGSFSAAADALGYTQSAISHQIAALEREAGMTLVERGSRPVRLTPAGEMIVEESRTAIAALERAEMQVHKLAGLRAGRLAIAAFPSACTTLVPDALARLRKRNAELEVTLNEAGPSAVAAPLRRGEIDVAIVFSNPAAPQSYEPPIQTHHLFEDPLYVQVPSTHPLARRKSVDLASLAGNAWIAPSPQRSGAGDFRQLFEDLCERSGFRPRIAVETEDRASGQGLVAAGLGLLLTTEMTLGRLTREGVSILRLRDAPPAREISALTIDGREVPAVTEFLDCLNAVGPSGP
jgi:DNA-binding transcriptional LysR family regulator